MLELLLLAVGISSATVAKVLTWAGILGIAGVIYGMLKRYETRTVLLSAGFILSFLTLQPLSAFKAFETSLMTMMIKTILPVVGFASVMKLTKCDAHMVNLLVGVTSRMRLLVVPAVVVATSFINISLTSAAGVSAAVGAVMIPLMMSMGVHPAVAGAAIMAGTYGSKLSPGSAHNSYIASELLKNNDVMGVIGVHYKVTIACIFIGAIGLTLFALFRKELSGYVLPEDRQLETIEKPKIHLAIIPLIPVALLTLSAVISGASAPEWGKNLLAHVPWFKKLSVCTAMLIGTFLGLLATRTAPSAATKEFFKGMSNAYGSIIGIILAAGVFVGGLHAVGLIEAMVGVMKSMRSIALYTATFGPFILAIITGSGDAAAMAFNAAVTPFARDFGMGIAELGSLSTLAGSLGRTVSPIAGATVLCAGLAGCSPVEIAKRNAPGIFIALIYGMIMLGGTPAP